jgi:protein-disulfide isomerase
MSAGKRIAEIILIIIAVFAVLFVVQVGINVYKIKTGKLTPYSFGDKLSHLKGEAISAPQIKAEEIVSLASPSFGANNPELTIVEFGNFSCPNSKEAAATARELMLKYKNKIKFIYREFPLDDIYPASSYLSLAGKCANEQGYFWPMHDKIYQASGANPLSIAPQIGINTEIFTNCLKEKKFAVSIAKDFSDGYKNGVAGTPTFVFIKKGLENSPLMIPGAIPKDIFEKIIIKLLE